MYLFLVLNRSTALQSQSFLKNIESFLCKQKLVNNHSIPSTHAERKLPIFLVNTLLLHIPLLALNDGLTDRMTELAVRGLEERFFQLCCCVSFLVLAGNRFWCYLHT
jgi:hypothetical protein